MKKSLLALAVLGAFASAASAQSSVTLSGRVDAGVIRSNNQWSMGGSQSGYNAFTLSGSWKYREYPDDVNVAGAHDRPT